MIVPCMGDRRWQGRVKIARLETKKLKRGVDKNRVRRCTTRRGRRQGHTAFATGFDADWARVEFELEHTFTGTLGQNTAKGNGGMTAECNLLLGRKIAHTPAVAFRCSEDSFGIAHLGGKSLHVRHRGQHFPDYDTCRVAPGRAVAKGRETEDFHSGSVCHFLDPIKNRMMRLAGTIRRMTLATN